MSAQDTAADKGKEFGVLRALIFQIILKNQGEVPKPPKSWTCESRFATMGLTSEPPVGGTDQDGNFSNPSYQYLLNGQTAIHKSLERLAV